jgi:hypothetical protein
MGTPERRSDEALVSQLTAARLSMVPEALPEGTRFPTAPAVIDGIPVAKVAGYIPPWNTGTSVIKHGFEDQTVTELRRTTGVVFDGPHTGCPFSPNGIGDHQASGQRQCPPPAKLRGKPIAN